MSTEKQIDLLGAGDIVDTSANTTVITPTPPPLATHKKNDILERLNKRNKDRQNHLDIKSEQRNREQSEGEGVDYFAQSFTKRARDIEEHIKAINERTKTTTAIGTADLVREFAEITMQIQELERYLTVSTMFLTDFKIKQCQTILNNLSVSSEETRQRLLPKKKFGFSGKKVASKPIVNPKVTQASQDMLDNNAAKTMHNVSAFTWTLSNRQNEHITLNANEVNGKDITASNLNNCLVELQGHAGSVQLSHITNCTFLCGPIARSFFAEYCQHSTLALACQQLRLHSSTSMRIYLHVTCRAIIEDCKQIEIANYNYEYDGIDGDFTAAGLDKSHNNYADVADFNWLSPDMHSPNWKLLDNVAEEQPNWQLLRQKYKESKLSTTVLLDNKQL